MTATRKKTIKNTGTGEIGKNNKNVKNNKNEKMGKYLETNFS